MKKILLEQLDPDKENYYLDKKDIGVMGSKLLQVKDDTHLYNVEVKNGEVVSVKMPDGVGDFEVDDINSQLQAGATLGAAITGESNNNQTQKLKEVIKKHLRKHILSK